MYCRFIQKAIFSLLLIGNLFVYAAETTSAEMSLEKAQASIAEYSLKTPEEQQQIKSSIIPFIYKKISMGIKDAEEYTELVNIARSIDAKNAIIQLQNQQSKFYPPADMRAIEKPVEAVTKEKKEIKVKKRQKVLTDVPQVTVPIHRDTQFSMRRDIENLTADSLKEMITYVEKAEPEFAPNAHSKIANKIHFVWLGGPIPEAYWRNIKKIAHIGQNGASEADKFTIHIWVENKENIEKIKRKGLYEERMEKCREIIGKLVQNNKELVNNHELPWEVKKKYFSVENILQAALKNITKFSRGLIQSPQDPFITFMGDLANQLAEAQKVESLDPSNDPLELYKIQTTEDLEKNDRSFISTILPNEELYVKKRDANGNLTMHPLVQIRDINEVKKTVTALFDIDNYAKYIWTLIRTEMVGLKNYASAADYLRLFILYQEGGMYLDIDTKALGSSNKHMKFNFYQDNGISDELGNPLGYGFNFKIQYVFLKDEPLTIENGWTNNALIVSSAENPIMKALIYKTFDRYFDKYSEYNLKEEEEGIEKKRHIWKKEMIDITAQIALWAADSILNEINFAVKESPNDYKICQFYNKYETCHNDVFRLLTAPTIGEEPGKIGEPFQIGSVKLLHLSAMGWTKNKVMPKSFSEASLKKPVNTLE